MNNLSLYSLDDLRSCSVERIYGLLESLIHVSRHIGRVENAAYSKIFV